MREMNLCEEAGTGWDKIVAETERSALPAPKVVVEEHSTRVTVYGPRRLMMMSQADKLRAVYFHACLRWAQGGNGLTTASLRERFAIAPWNACQVSRLLAEAVDAGLITVYDETVGAKAKSYTPYSVSAG